MAFFTVTVTRNFNSPWAQRPLTLAGKRYIPGANLQNDDGVTLVFFHCTGFHKEIWEPTIEHAFQNVKDSASGWPIIREAWSFDMHNHGEAAALNEEAFKEGKTGLTVEECAEAFKAFHKAGVLKGHKLIGIGHSLGASALILTTVASQLPAVAFQSIVLIEPALIDRALYDANKENRSSALNTFYAAIGTRKDEWTSRDEAAAYFKKRFPWRFWETRVLALYVKHGLRDVTVREEGKRVSKVKLCCAKEHEPRAYVQDEVYFDVVDRIVALDRSVPIHYIFGDRFDAIPEWVYNSLLALGHPASVQRVSEAGHLTPQENPVGLAIAIQNVLLGTAPERTTPKL